MPWYEPGDLNMAWSTWWQGLGLLLAPPSCWSCGQPMPTPASLGCCIRCKAHCVVAQRPWGTLDEACATIPYFAPLLAQMPIDWLLYQWQRNPHPSWERYLLHWWQQCINAFPGATSWFTQATWLTCIQGAEPTTQVTEPSLRFAQALAKSYQISFVPLSKLHCPAKPTTRAKGPILLFTPILHFAHRQHYLQLQAQWQSPIYVIALAQQPYCPKQSNDLDAWGI